MDCLTPLPVEPCALDRCLYHYLAQPVLADRDIPAADRAAMDGYAVRADDVVSVPTTLRVVGEVAAGSAARPEIAAGECVRILTGANVPPDADTVVMVEETDQPAPDTVTVLSAARRGQHILRRGENARQCDVLIEAGGLLDGSALALCAAVGCANPLTHAIPRVGVLTTGSELKAAKDEVGAHEIRDSNGPLLAAAVATHGFGPAECRRVPDEHAPLIEALRASLEQHEVTLVSGGVSVGKYDLVPGILRELGATVRYHGIAIKPGKPQLFATVGNGRYVFGLPGNPLAVMVGLHEFALPALRRLAGCPEAACRPLLRLPLRHEVTAKGPRRHYLLGRLASFDSGTAIVPVPNSGSSEFVAGCKADGTIIMPDGVSSLPAGAVVDFRPWRTP
jgi:molybdopterin molybdotransferase